MRVKGFVGVGNGLWSVSVMVSVIGTICTNKCNVLIHSKPFKVDVCNAIF